jgi:catechol 2,3-dioxygenase-like lactoylglutathione lyase family enzyme
LVRRHDRGFHHLGLPVRDADASAAWYVEVLGFHRVGEFESPDGTRRKVFLRHDGLPVRLGLTQHRHGSQEVFDETRVGLDHLAFAWPTASRWTAEGHISSLTNGQPPFLIETVVICTRVAG